MQKLPILARSVIATLSVISIMLLAIVWQQRPIYAQSNLRDCSANSVIRCGALSIPELKQKYLANQGGNVQALYDRFGITSTSSFNGMVYGYVDTANNVYIDSGSRHILVGKNAISVGRENITNKYGHSTPIMNGQFYLRPPRVSFASASGTLAALIKLDANGRFLFAVLTSCGNAVAATPLAQSTKPVQSPTQTTAAPTTPTPTATSPIAATTVTVAPITAAPAASSQSAPQQLVNTGTGSFTGLFAAVSIGGFIMHRRYLERRLGSS